VGINESLLVSSTAYICNTNFSNVIEFSDFINKTFTTSEVDLYEILNHLDAKIEELSTSDNKIGQKEALGILLARELEKIKKVLEQKLVFDDIEDEIRNCVERYCELLNKIDLSIEDIHLHFVDKFPEPFSNLKFNVMNFDDADSQKYGIKKGIYFRKDKIAPFRSSLIAAHEIMHQLISKRDPHILARGLEDGICDFMGTLYLGSGSNVFSFNECENFLRTIRLGDWTLPSWVRYRINLRQACLLYLQYGFDGIKELIKNGRRQIAEVEEKYLKGANSMISLPKGNWDTKFTEFAIRFINFDTTLVVSPLARYIAEKIEEGDAISNIIKEYNLCQKDAEKAFEELRSTNVFLIIIKNGVITSDKTKPYIISNVMRYRVKYNGEKS